MPNRKVTQKEIDYIKATYGKIPTIQIAKTLDCQPGTIRNTANRYGIRAGAAKSYTEENDEYIMAEIAKGTFIKDIAKVLGRTSASIHTRSSKLGVNVWRRPYTNQYTSGVQELWSEDQKNLLINQIGVRKSTIVSDKLKRGSRHSARRKARNFGYYWKNGSLSGREIAKIIGIHPNTVYRYLHKFHLSRRDLYLTDVGIVARVAQAILDNPIAVECCAPSLKHLESCARDDWELP